MGTEPKTATTRTALRVDLAEGARTLAEAFTADPWFSWLYPDEAARPAQATEWFGLVLDRAFTMGHTYATPAGIVNWAPPDVHFPQPEDIERAVELLGGQIGDRAQTALGIVGQVGGVFPDRPRFHCIYVGVRPDAQGTGQGAALLRRVLDICDREALPASLTSSNDRNLPFYERLGFTEIGAVPIAETGRSMRPMWREPVPTP